MEEIVRSQADMEIVCRDSSVDISVALERRDADVAVLREAAADQAAEGRLVLVTYSERDGGAFSFRPLPIAELSPQTLVQAIREARAARERT
ncbi:MAG: hypothetical protein HYY76_14685 [Acidobacteria bacterium]|nr:hypothetical protein [Acidobacteriota bacterium]